MTNLISLPQVEGDCWNHIGIRGDRSCPELAKVVHCHNCQVFATAGRRFLDAPSPVGYLDEWTNRLASPIEVSSADLQGVLIFRLADEWLAFRVQVLAEVTSHRRVHRVPHRGGLLAGLVNIRGELHLCVHLDQALGLQPSGEGTFQPDAPARQVLTRPTSETELTPTRQRGNPQPEDHTGASGLDSFRKRLLVVRREAERWVFPVDEVDQVHRFPLSELTRVPATVGRSLARLTRGLLQWQGRSVGLLDDERLFATLRGKIR